MESIVKPTVPDFTLSYSEDSAYVRVRFCPKWSTSGGTSSPNLGEALLKQGMSIPGWNYNYKDQMLFKDIVTDTDAAYIRTIHISIVEAQAAVTALMDKALEYSRIAAAWRMVSDGKH